MIDDVLMRYPQAMAIARLTKYEDLITYLRENNVPHTAEAGNLSITLQVAGPEAAPVFIRFEKGLPYVQVIYPFIANVPDERVPEVADAICRANNTIKLPGFGYEYGSHVIYMRLCVQLYEDGITPTMFQRLVLGVLENAKQFARAFGDVVAGTPGKDVLDLAIKYNQPG